MRYILPPHAFSDLNLVRDEYQKAKQVDLEQPPSTIRRPTFLGGTDILSRRVQIGLLEKFQCVLKATLLPEEEIKTEQQLQAHLTASRTMLAVYLYINSQISRPKSNSELFRLLQKDLGITQSNDLDEEDRDLCISAAKKLITSSLSVFEDANAALRKAGMPLFTKKEWENFEDYLCNYKLKLAYDPYRNYPITSITQPLFGATFAYAGATVGLILGDSVSKSTKVMSAKYQLTACVGGTILVFGSAGPGGVALFAPIIAERLINAFFSISFGHLFGIAMGLVGQGVGIGIGIPLDLGFRLLKATVASLINYSLNEVLPTGRRIGDGATVIHGIEIKRTLIDENKGKNFVVEIKGGKLYLNDVPVPKLEEAKPLPPEVLEELKAKLKLASTGETEGLTQADEGEIEDEREYGEGETSQALAM